ncbi:MAG TPA: hypothetical protein PKE45_21475, partial [Caldilineaceae bacterium]|nr:hypothetical protein [Caldilineaceae bacterium]
MTTTNDTDTRFAPIIRAAEQLLSQRSVRTVKFTNVECITDEDRRNRLFRCSVEKPSAGIPASLILKQVVAKNYQPDDATAGDTVRFFRDWVGAEFLSNLPGDPGHAPRFYGGDRQLGFIILEDLGQ